MCKWQHSCLSSDVSKYAQNSHVGSESWMAIDRKLTWGQTEAEPNSPQQELAAKEANPRQQRDHSSSRSPSYHLGNLLLKDWSAWVLLCAVMLYFSTGSQAQGVVASPSRLPRSTGNRLHSWTEAPESAGLPQVSLNSVWWWAERATAAASDTSHAISALLVFYGVLGQHALNAGNLWV